MASTHSAAPGSPLAAASTSALVAGTPILRSTRSRNVNQLKIFPCVELAGWKAGTLFPPPPPQPKSFASGQRKPATSAARTASEKSRARLRRGRESGMVSTWAGTFFFFLEVGVERGREVNWGNG